MNERDFDNMRQQRRNMLYENDHKQQQSPLTKFLNRRLFAIKKEEKNPSVDGKQEEEKSAIWWMITMFCIVYGFQVLYEAFSTVSLTP